MAKTPTAAIGIDFGRYAMKSVLVQRRGGNRFAVTHFGVTPTTPDSLNGDKLAESVKSLLNQMGGAAKACCAAVSSASSILRIIEQPQTPPELLRTGLRLNGPALLNQEVRDYVLDCAEISSCDGDPASAGKQRQYLVGGLERDRVSEFHEAFDEAKRPLTRLQLGPASAFNAFEFAKPDVFNNEPFILVDMGHEASSVTVGVKGQLVLVRAIEYGGRALMEALSTMAGERDVWAGLDSGDELLVDTARMSLVALTREVSSSIGFFEGRREETISQIFVSGGLARSQRLLDLMSEELRMPCEAWHAFEHCEITMPESRKSLFAQEAVNLGVACGAAIELLRSH